MLLSKISTLIDCKKIYNIKKKNTSFNFLSTNSKYIKKNSVLVINKKNNFKKKYVDESIRRGAIALITNYYFKNIKIPQFIVKDVNKSLKKLLWTLKKIPPNNIIGVTGTNGKTSVVWNISNILFLSKKNVKSYGTLGFYNNQKKIENSILTTPEYEILHQKAFTHTKKNIDEFVFEVSSHSISKQRINHFPINIAAITNISKDHLDFHKTILNYRNTKFKLFTQHLKDDGVAILNDNINGIAILKKKLKQKKIKIITYGARKSNVHCYILNTCHIRDKAKEKVFHEIGRIKKIYRGKNKPIMVMAGCVAQAENQEVFSRDPYIDIVIGPQSYHKMNDLLESHISEKKFEETEFDSVSKFKYYDGIENKNNSVSAYLTIQEGCDKFCHFCVVPYTRGPEYSRPFNQIVNEAEQLVKNGVKEITLLGQNVNAYYFQENSKEYRISDLINHLDKFNEIKRIRYTTSHPKDMTDDLIECYKKSEKLMPLVHLPIQSGSDRILKLMNRKHKVEDYLDVYFKIKKLNPDVEFSSDFIIGYPGETEKDFSDTLELLEKIRFINSFSFIFSPRPGTTAANLEMIDNEIAKKRLIIIQEKLFNNQIELNKSMEDKKIEVLVENKLSDQNKLFGRNKYLSSVVFKGSENHIGKLVDVKINNSNQNTLFGEIETNMKAA